MLFRLLRRSLRQRPQRFAIAVLSVAMGTAVAVAFAGVSLALGDRLALSLRVYGANLVLLPEGGSFGVELAGTDYRPPVRTGAIAESTLTRIHDTFWRNNVLGYAPQLTVPARLHAGGDTLVATVVGTWFERELTTPRGYPFTAGMTTVAPWWQVSGRLPRETDPANPEALIGRVLAARLGVARDDQVHVATETGGPLRARVAGVLEAGGVEDEALYLPLAAVQTLAARPGEVDRVLVSALIKPGFPPAPDRDADPAEFERWACTPYVTSVAYEMDRALPGVEARPVSQLVEAEGRVVHRLNLLMLLLTLAALVAAALGVTSTVTATVVERQQEFALQRALGASTWSLAGTLALEAAVVGLAGGVVGSALGFALAAIAGRVAFGLAVPVQPLLLVLGLVVAVLVTAAGSWAPLRWATRVPPAEGLRP